MNLNCKLSLVFDFNAQRKWETLKHAFRGIVESSMRHHPLVWDI
jgi:hypothetical protein